jgi:putative SOS response-associated peptidase YedK
MCGRVRLSSDVSEIKLVFSIPPHRPTPNFPPSWNAAPTDLLLVLRYDHKAGERSLNLLRWGLIPHWAKDIAELHNRMPVVLGPETWPVWLGEEPADPRKLKAPLAPYPS